MKGCPSVKELTEVLNLAESALANVGFGELFIYDKNNIQNKQVNQFALSLYVPLVLKMIDKIDFEGEEWLPKE